MTLIDDRDYWRSCPRTRPADNEIDTPGPGQESVWDYPRPPVVEGVDRKITIVVGGIVIANTTQALRVIETGGAPVYYLPPDDIRTEYLSPAEDVSLCEWKGQAHYWNITVDGATRPAAAWSYPYPFAPFAAISGHIAFYASIADHCYLGRERVKPQPGDYYGGWISSEICGPFKGAPGTESW